MPNVPVLEGQQVQPQSYQMPSVFHIREEAFGTNVAQAQANFANVIEKQGDYQQKVAIQQQQTLDKAAVINADMHMRNDLQNLINPLLSTEMYNAQGITQKFNEEAGEIQTKYANGMHGQDMQQEFSLRSAAVIMDARQKVYGHEQEQIKAGQVKGLQFNIQQHADQDSTIGFINWANTSLAGDLKSQMGYNDDMAQSAVTQSVSAKVAADIKTQIDSENYPVAQQMFNLYGDKMLPETRNTILGELTKKNNDNTEFLTANNIAAQCIGANGKPDLAKAEAMLKNDPNIGPNATKTLSAGDYISQRTAFKTALASIESPGYANPYIASNKSGAYGKYQFMPGTWTDNLKAMGLPLNTPQTPENQEKVADFAIDQLYKASGGNWGKVAVSWQAGSGHMNDSDAQLASISDGNKTTLDYRNSVMANFKPSNTPQTVSVFDAQRFQRVESLVKGILSNTDYVYNQHQNEIYKNTWDTIDKVTNYSDGMKIISAANLDDPAKADTLERKLRINLHVDDDGIPITTSATTHDAALAYLQTNPDASVSTFFSQSFSQDLSKADRERYTNYILSGANKVPWNQVINDTIPGFDKQHLPAMLDGITEAVAQYKKDNGKYPNPTVQQQIVRNLNADIVTSDRSSTIKMYQAYENPKDVPPADLKWVADNNDPNGGYFMAFNHKTNKEEKWYPSPQQ